MHFAKSVLHLQAVDASAATPETHQKHTNQSETQQGSLAHQSMVHPEGALCEKGASLTLTLTCC
jgi:hypothetical protein